MRRAESLDAFVVDVPGLKILRDMQDQETCERTNILGTPSSGLKAF